MANKVWNNKYLKLPLIVKSSSWRFIHDFSELESCSGIFIFANSAHKVNYIGYAEDSSLLETIANAIENNNDKNSTLILALYTKSTSDSKVIANILLERYEPANNKRKMKYKYKPAGIKRSMPD